MRFEIILIRLYFYVIMVQWSDWEYKVRTGAHDGAGTKVETMVKAIGIDIIEIGRVARAVERSPRFLERVFTVNEIQYFQSKDMKMETIAGGFAAKEAVVKTLGTGLRGFRWQDIEILRDDLGKPYVNLWGEALKVSRDRNFTEVMISISHCKEYAVANSIAV